LIELKRENAGIPEDGILQISDELTLDLFKGGLRANSTGKIAYLTGKPLGLLLFLASTPGEAVTCDSIINHVWGNHVLSKNPYDKERVQVTVSRLREKIASLGLNFDPIVNHPQRGYSFSPKPRNTD